MRNKKNKISQYWEEYKGSILAILGIYAVWKYLLPVLSPVSSALASAVQDVAVKATNTSLAGAKAQDIERLKSDANAIAEALGTKSGKYVWSISEDEHSAWQVLKHYKKLTSEGKPKAATWSASALQPFYADITGGRSLKNDCFTYISESEYQYGLSQVF